MKSLKPNSRTHSPWESTKSPSPATCPMTCLTCRISMPRFYKKWPKLVIVPYTTTGKSSPNPSTSSQSICVPLLPLTMLPPINTNRLNFGPTRAFDLLCKFGVIQLEEQAGNLHYSQSSPFLRLQFLLAGGFYGKSAV